MIVNSPSAFLDALEQMELPVDAPVNPKAVFMIEPAGFHLSEDTAKDNLYMDLSVQVNAQKALEQHRRLAEAIERAGITVIRFTGHSNTPDGVFPNNVFASVPGRFIVGKMLSEERQKEAQRSDVRHFFTEVLGYEEMDLSQQDLICELTGPLILDRGRRIGFCGMTQRVDDAGCEAMHRAFNSRLTFQFDLKPNEYHTNVVMAVLASRACVMVPEAFADPEVPKAIAAAYPGRTLFLTNAEKEAFAGNCIALSDTDLFMSQAGSDALRDECKQRLNDWGFTLHSIGVDELEKAGGSLRCMVAEIF